MTPLTHFRKKVKELRGTFENPKMEFSNVSHNSFTSFLKCVRGVSFAARPKRVSVTLITRPCTVELPGRVIYVTFAPFRPSCKTDTPHTLQEKSEGVVWDIRKTRFKSDNSYAHERQPLRSRPHLVIKTYRKALKTYRKLLKTFRKAMNTYRKPIEKL